MKNRTPSPQFRENATDMASLNELPYTTAYTITYRQKEVLRQTLAGLFNQSYPATRYEIVVLDDGSEDGTRELLSDLTYQSPVPMKVLCVFHEADYLSAKRFNQCVSAASEATDVFVHVEDAIVRPDLIWQHVKWHMQPIACLVSGAMFEGKTLTWDIAASDPDRRYLSRSGDPVECDFQAAWAKSLSYTRTMMTVIWKEPYDRPFDERMTDWGYHEVEFAWRMLQAGARIIYDPAAGVFHPCHSESTESKRGFNRTELINKGEAKNIEYICRKHGLSGLDEWSSPRTITWIDRAIWDRAASVLRKSK
jgi:glycosyltransferase involved in cell wall biosynthesis